ncbi:hypothetical protein AKO1_002442 [Acrasis kona]|uniref:Uncharacterized protein n=1 Tax=Acrasis kona TaxID=1008807 RepID=A0AAW2YUV5_9EUKA
MHMINNQGNVIHDTYLEKLAISLIKSSIDTTYAFITGAIGTTLIYKGISPLLNQQDGPTANQQIKRTGIKRYFYILFNFLKNFFASPSSTNQASTTKCLWYGGVLGVGLWIMMQPCLSQLLKMNQTIIYHVK